MASAETAFNKETTVRKTITSMRDLDTDLAGTYRQKSGAQEAIAPSADEQQALARDGYLVLKNLLDADELAAIRAACAPLIGNTGRNNFEGLKTQRLYSPLSKTRVFDGLAAHPRILGLLDHVLQPNYLLSQAQAINILPGETAQMLHHDDGFYRMARPRPPLGVATIWAIDAFTEDNGATVVVPGSHVWGDGPPPADAARRSAVMPAGSVLFFVGTLWHGGGENRSAAARLAVTCQYCQPWLRQQESFLLEVPTALAAEMSEPLQAMIGYSVHPPFIGMVNGMHPKRLLEPKH